MPRFHFHLRARGMIHRDFDGTDLPDLTAAHDHAREVAKELMHHCDGAKRHWSLRVEDESGQPQLDLFFADIDPSLASYSPQLRMMVSDTCRRLGALTDVLCAARDAQTEARILLARARGKPQLVYAKNE